ncbi:MAG: 30S ribosome-binding factor RbfA [Ardenticatenaceae bacterium]|nr:30S ribosome-binding factor RbfA [Ardenticatenaceae bacterium]HBY98397.1 30S ribosome-binding factor RbfA [Chloroflexota bacterium]
MSRRQHQVAEAIQAHVDMIIRRELRDPRVGMVTVTRVDVSEDLQNATIFVTVLGAPEEEKETLKALRGAEGFIRRELAHRLRLRYVPQIHFAPDVALDQAMRVYELLEELNLPAEGEETRPPDETGEPGAADDS